MASDPTTGGDVLRVLTAQERRVMLAVGRGATTKATARELGVSTKTVEYHLGNIYRKLHVQGRAELAHLVGSLSPAHHPRSESGNLPHPRSRLIGREQQLADLTKAIDEHRLVSVVGAGGVGKTRLALEACRGLAAGFRDGAWLVELAALDDADRVGSSVAIALGVQLRGELDPVSVVTDVLRDQQRLLLLDNCEHVIDAAAEAIDAIGAQCPAVTVVTTSRERLELDGERVLVLSPLELGSEHEIEPSEAVRLFCDRAALVLGRFEPGPPERCLVDTICQALDGLPLAIELAAAQLASSSLEEIVAGLDHRFGLLARRRGASERQLSLHATFAWSYELLDPAEQHLLDDVSVFLGGFDIKTAADLTGGPGTEPSIIALERASLLDARPGPLGARYGMLETIRQFGTEHLRERGLLDHRRHSHLTAMLSFAERANLGVRSHNELPWHQAFLAEWPNLDAAFSTACREGDTDSAYRLLSETFWWGLTRLRLDLARWADAALALRGGSDHPLRPAVSAAAFFFGLLLGDFEQLGARFSRAQADDVRLGPGGEPWVPCVASWSPDPIEQKMAATRAVEARGREQGQLFWVVVGACQTAMGQIWRRNRGDVSTEVAAAEARRATELAEQLGNENGIAYAALALGEALKPSAVEEAITLFERSLSLSEPLGVENTSTQARRSLITAYTAVGRPLDALALAGPSLARHQRAGSRFQADSDLLTAAPALARAGRPDVAAVVVGWVHAQGGESLGEHFGFGELTRQLSEQLGSAELDRILAESASLTQPEVVDRALDAIEGLVEP